MYNIKHHKRIYDKSEISQTTLEKIFTMNNKVWKDEQYRKKSLTFLTPS